MTAVSVGSIVLAGSKVESPKQAEAVTYGDSDSITINGGTFSSLSSSSYSSGTIDIKSTLGLTYRFGYSNIKSGNGYVMLQGAVVSKATTRGYIYNVDGLGKISSALFSWSGGPSAKSYNLVSFSTTTLDAYQITNSTTAQKAVANGTHSFETSSTDEKGFMNVSNGQADNDGTARNGQMKSLVITFAQNAAIESAASLATYVMEADTEGQCTTKYALAKEKFLAMGLAEQDLFKTAHTGEEASLTSARARYSAWASSRGDSKPFEA